MFFNYVQEVNKDLNRKFNYVMDLVRVHEPFFFFEGCSAAATLGAFQLSAFEKAETKLMDIAGKVWSLLGKRDNLIHGFLAASFVALSIRSVGQQSDIEALQSEKDALQATNKAMKKAMWDWKQQLFREAAENADAPVPLSTLQAIYGDNPSVQQQQQQPGTCGIQLLTI
ncbi:hypothetical protein ACLOJK_020982 [Asimina triloba]